MKIHTAFLATAAALILSASAFAAPKTYQVTGPILAVTDTSITVKKGTETWEVARDSSTKVTGALKVGSKVTIEYTMTAVNAEVKAADAPKKHAPKKGDKAK